jgi:hypothetical protein
MVGGFSVKVIEGLNQIKDILKDIEVSALDLDPGIKEQAVHALEDLRDAINNAAALVDNYYTQRQESKTILKDILDKFQANPLFSGLDKETLSKYAQAIANKPKLKILEEPDLRNIIAADLRRSSSEDLIHKAYDREEIVRMGRRLTPGTNEKVAYQRGLESLTNLAETPSGLLEIIQIAESKILDNPQTLKRYFDAYFLGGK